ncbi:MAG: hypothetical protein COB15_04045 [Flavobacteriales bacterium]|nr:MAG: hypothetical protein COB15_04045 [Flavobacteriales bacterium]
MSEETTDTGSTAEAGKRPVFLTVLCILSFIAAGFAILGYVTLIGVASAASAIAGTALEGLEGMEGMESMGDAMAAVAGPSVGMMWANIVVGFLATIVALIGVLKMWNLKESGFMIYAGATAVSVIMSIIYTGFMLNIVGIIISGAFIAMYFVNKKHMTA